MSSGKCPGCLKPGSSRMLEVKAMLEVTSQLPYYVDKESRPRKVEGRVEISKHDPEQTNVLVFFPLSLVFIILLLVSPHWNVSYTREEFYFCN